MLRYGYLYKKKVVLDKFFKNGWVDKNRTKISHINCQFIDLEELMHDFWKEL